MRLALLSAVLLIASSAQGTVHITEYMYSGAVGEFIEFTNTGAVPVDMTGWSFDDDHRIPGGVALSAFGLIQPGESVILTEATAAAFRTEWSLDAAVKVIGGSTHNLGRADEINLYDAGGQLVDRLTYDDQGIAGSIRTNGSSGWAEFADLGTNDILKWKLSVEGDAQASVISAGDDIGNPGAYVVPEPATMTLAAVGGLLLAVRRRRQQ